MHAPCEDALLAVTAGGNAYGIAADRVHEIRGWIPAARSFIGLGGACGCLDVGGHPTEVYDLAALLDLPDDRAQDGVVLMCRVHGSETGLLVDSVCGIVSPCSHAKRMRTGAVPEPVGPTGAPMAVLDLPALLPPRDVVWI